MGFYPEDPGNGGYERECSITTGTVKENWDKDHPGMIRVEYFLGTKGKNLTGWIPVMMPYAGKKYGSYALPEVGDMVVIGFERGDRNCPIALGALYSKVNTIPEKTAVEKNTVKRFMTKGGCVVEFSDADKKEKIQMTTPGKLKILMEDEKAYITISDDKGDNGVEIDSKNGTVRLKAAKKLELCVGSDKMVVLDGSSKAMTLKAGKIDAKADQAVNIKGSNTQISGSMLTLKGDSTVKAEASGILQVKGSMVKIN